MRFLGQAFLSYRSLHAYNQATFGLRKHWYYVHWWHACPLKCAQFRNCCVIYVLALERNWKITEGISRAKSFSLIRSREILVRNGRVLSRLNISAVSNYSWDVSCVCLLIVLLTFLSLWPRCRLIAMAGVKHEQGNVSFVHFSFETTSPLVDIIIVR